MLVIKRRFSKFYLGAAIIFLICIGVCILLALMYVDVIEEDQLSLKAYLLLVFSPTCFIAAFLSVRNLFKQVPVIKVDHIGFSLGKQQYLFSDLKGVILTGKLPFKNIFEQSMEGAQLNFKDGTKRYLYDDMYYNLWEFKLLLEQIIVRNKKQAKRKSIRIKHKSSLFQNTIRFKGIQLFNIIGVSFWFGTLLLLLEAAASLPHSLLHFFGLIGLNLSWFFMHSYLMHYFSLSEEFLIIQNHLRFWQKNHYCLSEIKEVTFESPGIKSPNCLRIISSDYQSKLYHAGTLQDKTWIQLKKQLEQRNIPVRNECIYYR